MPKFLQKKYWTKDYFVLYLTQVRQKIFGKIIKKKFFSSKLKVKQKRIFGYKILLPINEVIGRQLYFFGQYEFLNTCAIKKIVQKDWVCLDVGANIGYMTLLLSRLAKKGFVHAFEPNPLMQAFLRINVYQNILQNVKLHDIALSNSNGNQDFFITEDTAFASLKDTKRNNVTHKITVATETLDDFVEKKSINRIDFIKMDIEGAEGFVLDGANKTLSKLSPKVLMLELRNDNLDPFGYSVEGIMQKLEEKQYFPSVFTLAKGFEPYVLDKHKHIQDIFFFYNEESQ